MATGKIPNPKDAIEQGSVTAVSGYKVSSVNIQKLGKICCVSFTLQPSGSGSIPTTATTLATIQDGFRPVQLIETPVLTHSSWQHYMYKGRISPNGSVVIQGGGDGTGAPTWVNVMATYITS